MTTQQVTRGYRFGSIRLTGFVGAGGFADVYEGFTSGERRVAVKVLRRGVARPDPEALLRFRREAEVVAVVQSRHVAAFIDADLDADPPWIATEFVDGVSLSSHLEQSGPLPTAAVHELALVLAEALEAIHACGVVHRDVTTHNVILGPSGPVLVDFGISSLLDATRITQTGQAFGTPGFVAPEVLDGQPTTPATDIYGWGRVVRAAAGIEADAPATDGLSGAAADVVDRSVADDPTARPSLAEIEVAFAADAGRTDRRESLGRASEQRAAVSKLPRRFRPRTVVAAVVLGALIATAVAIAINRSRDDGVLQFADVPGEFTAALGSGADMVMVPTGGAYLSSALVPDGWELEVRGSVGGYDGGEVVLERLSGSDDGYILDVGVVPMTKSTTEDALAALADPQGSEASLRFQERANAALRARSAALNADLSSFGCDEEFTEPQVTTVSGQDAIGLAAFSSCGGARAVIDLWIPDSRQKVTVLVSTDAPFDLESFITDLGISETPVVRELEDEEIDLLEVPPQAYDPGDADPPSYLNVAFDVPASTDLQYSADPDDFITQRWLRLATVGDSPATIRLPAGAQSANRANLASATISGLLGEESVLVGYFESPAPRPSIGVSPVEPAQLALPLNALTEATAEGRTTEGLSESDWVDLLAVDDPDAIVPLNDLDDSYGMAPRDSVSFAEFDFTVPSSWAREQTSSLFRASRGALLRPSSTDPDFEHLLIRNTSEAGVAAGQPISLWVRAEAGLTNCPVSDLNENVAQQGGKTLRWVILTQCEVSVGPLTGSGFSRPQAAPVVVFQLLSEGEELLRGRSGLSNSTAIFEWLLWVDAVMGDEDLGPQDD